MSLFCPLVAQYLHGAQLLGGTNAPPGSTVSRKVEKSKLANNRERKGKTTMLVSMLDNDTSSCDSWVYSDVDQVLFGLSVLTCYWVHIDSVDVVPELKHKALGNGNCFMLNFTRVQRQNRVCYVIPPVSFFQNRSKVHSSGAELIQADTIPADTLSDYGIIIGLRHMPFWLWIIIVPSGGTGTGTYQAVESMSILKCIILMHSRQ